MVDSKKASQAGNKGRGMPHSLSWHKICIFAALTPRHLKVSAASHLLCRNTGSGVMRWRRSAALQCIVRHLSKDSWYISSSLRLPLGVILRLAARRSSSRSFRSAPLSQKIFTCAESQNHHQIPAHRITESRPGCSRGGRRGCPPPPWGRHTCRSGRAVEDLSLLFVYWNIKNSMRSMKSGTLAKKAAVYCRESIFWSWCAMHHNGYELWQEYCVNYAVVLSGKTKIEIDI